jgi:hypothetical protein
VDVGGGLLVVGGGLLVVGEGVLVEVVPDGGCPLPLHEKTEGPGMV